nr:3-deoxy-7-phosphoheptulonate synthase [Iningainema tapete BLCC-T55]
KAMSDGPQSLKPADFVELMQELAALAQFFGRGNQSTVSSVTQFASKIPVGVGV